MNESVILFFAAVLVFGGLLLAIIALTRKGVKHLNRSYYQAEWLKIENRLVRDEEQSYQMCVINADKLVDHALKQRGFSGDTMGDRLKSANKELSNKNAVWSAHKLRNKIVHESESRISYDDARYALGGFKQGLKDLGAI